MSWRVDCKKCGKKLIHSGKYCSKKCRADWLDVNKKEIKRKYNLHKKGIKTSGIK